MNRDLGRNVSQRGSFMGNNIVEWSEDNADAAVPLKEPVTCYIMILYGYLSYCT